MAEISYLENHEIAKKKSSDFDEIWHTTANLELDD